MWRKLCGVATRKSLRLLLFLLWCRRGQGLGVPGGAAAAGGSSAGSKPADEKRKRKKEDKAAGAGEKKRPWLQTKRTTGVSQTKPAVEAEPQDGGFSSLFDAPLSRTHDVVGDADAGVNKEFTRSPSIEVVTEPSVQAEDTGKKPAARKSPAANKVSGSTSGDAGVKGLSIQPDEFELEFYYRTYTEDRSINYHRPPWNVMQGDDISTVHTACRDILSGLGTPFKVFRARGLSREQRINQLSSMLVGSSIMANAIMEDFKVLGHKDEEAARLRCHTPTDGGIIGAWH
ncbi:hypothetical protein HanIR_Chr17g0867761 [Helianthus annuus]|nr:hypothetical protein HanIR_Chr17g0867761 [Helianthus annuus]